MNSPASGLHAAWFRFRQYSYPSAFRVAALHASPGRGARPATLPRGNAEADATEAGNLQDEAVPSGQEPDPDAAERTPDERTRDGTAADSTAGDVSAAAPDARFDRAFGDVAHTLWYLKARFLRHAWAEPAATAEEPRTRRAVRQIDRAASALEKVGVSIDDPINRRFPHGAEAIMQPLDYQPKPGLDEDTVIETAAPIVSRDERIIRRGEVFVGVPEEPGPTAA